MSDPNELRAIGERLLVLAEGGTLQDSSVPPATIYATGEELDDRFLAAVAQAHYDLRQERRKHLPPEMFGEPAWDMLLDLFITAVRGRRTAVMSLCIASNVPDSTALRWIGTLLDLGLVLREDAEHDRRVAYLKLSPKGFAALRRYLAQSLEYVEPRRNNFLLQPGGAK